MFAVLLVVWSATHTTTQTPAPQSAPTSLAHFEGHYEYRDDATLFIVADGDRLFAMIGESKYALIASGTDTFTNGVGDQIPFLRDASGRIVAFKEKGETFARISSDVPTTTRLLLEARPRGTSGRPQVYRYAPPPRLTDGIRTGVAGPDTLEPAVAEQLVNGVIDGTYPDVRAIARLSQGGAVAGGVLLRLRPRPAAPDAIAHQERDLAARGSGCRPRPAPSGRARAREAGLLSLRESRPKEGAGYTDRPPEQSVGLRLQRLRP